MISSNLSRAVIGAMNSPIYVVMTQEEEVQAAAMKIQPSFHQRLSTDMFPSARSCCGFFRRTLGGRKPLPSSLPSLLVLGLHRHLLDSLSYRFDARSHATTPDC